MFKFAVAARLIEVLRKKYALTFINGRKYIRNKKGD